MLKGNVLVSRVVQGFRSVINLVALEPSCDGLELQSVPSLPWSVFRARGVGRGHVLEGLFQS